MELADTPVLGTGAERFEGSSPSLGTKFMNMKKKIAWFKFQWFMFYEVELSGFSTYEEWKSHDEWLKEMAAETAEIFNQILEQRKDNS